MTLLRAHTLRFLAFLMVAALAFSACKRDKCKRVTCINGTCVDGTCNCSAGYYGAECNSIQNVGYAGTWSVEEDCIAGTDQYDVSIFPMPGSLTSVGLVGIWEQPDTLVAVVGISGFELAADRQRVGTADIDATATVTEDHHQMTLSYQVYHFGQSQYFDKCTATLVKN